MKKMFRKKKSAEKLPARITNDTVAQHREKVLAGGRKHKYPIQYTRNKLVRNTIIISLATLVVLATLVWLQLYVWRDTSELAYRITRVLPLPIAKVDGEFVRYSDYLMYYRSSVAALETQGRPIGDISNDRIQFQKEQALERAIKDTYVQKIARQRNIIVTDQQADELIDQQQKDSQLSKSAYIAVVAQRFNWSLDELRQAMKSTLLLREVAFSVDDQAAKIAQSVGDLISEGKALPEVAEKLGAKVIYQPDMIVPKDNSDGGLSTAASKLEVGKTSGAIKTLSGDGYYFITRQKGDNDMIAYSYIKVPLKVLNENFKTLKDGDGIKKYIEAK